MTPKDPFLEGTFWDKFWRPIRSRALLFTPEVWKTQKRIRKTIRNAFEKYLAPLRPPKNISPALFNKIFKSFFTAQNLHNKQVFFSPRGSAGGATLSSSNSLFVDRQ